MVLSALLAGDPVVLPTDTVYGLCCLPSQDAVRRLRALKNTPEEQPISLLCADLRSLLEHVPALAGRPELALLPGPFTLILANPDRTYPWLTGSRPSTIGVRVPVLRGEALAAVAEIRATEGDLVRVTLINNGTKFHSIHFHGIHKSEMDGVFEGIAPGGKFTYEFTAEPFGVFPYHCHMQPLEEHITHGLYGVFIIDPKKPRADADEMVMVMNGYDTDFDAENNFYTVNGIPYYYMHHPIQIDKNRLIRIYLLNILEFDPINNFHLHANMFDLYRTGTKLIPDEYTDIVTMSQGERGILEFSYKYPGKYMFHAHKTEFAEKGWVGLFLVKDSTAESATGNSNFTSVERNASYSTSEFSNRGNGTTSFVKTGGLN